MYDESKKYKFTPKINKISKMLSKKSKRDKVYF